MADNQSNENKPMPEETEQNPGMRMAAVQADPTISLEEARNVAAGESPNAAGSVAPSSVEDQVPSQSDPHATYIPSTDRPLPDEARGESSERPSPHADERS